jgi:predicted porin
MKAIFFLSIIAFAFYSAPSSRADEGETESHLYIQPEIGYAIPRVFTQSQQAEYKGLNYGASLFYKIGTDSFALAPFASYTFGTYDSTANTATKQESFRERSTNLGLKAYFGPLFVKASYAWVSATDQTVGLGVATIDDTSHGLGGGVGFVYSLSAYVKFEVSLDVQNVNFEPHSGGFPARSQYLRFGGNFGVSFLLPSGTPPRSYRLKSTAPHDYN